MTVTSTKITAGPYAGNGVSDAFSYGFGLEDKSEIRIFETNDNGVQTELTVDTDYTVNNVGVQTGGTVTRNAGPLPVGYEWYMRSNYIETQETEFESQGAFFPDIHEKAFDKSIRLSQQTTDIQQRSPRVKESYGGNHDLTLPDPVEGEIMEYTANGVRGTSKAEIVADTNAVVDTKLNRAGDVMTGALSVVDAVSGNDAMPKSSINTAIDNAVKSIAGVTPGVSEDYGFITTPVTEIKDYGTLS